MKGGVVDCLRTVRLWRYTLLVLLVDVVVPSLLFGLGGEQT
jgi:hypothetical protein